MKIIFYVFIIINICFGIENLHAQQMKIISVIESIVPLGLGRSRMLESTEPANLDGIVSERSRGNKNAKFSKKRAQIKVNGVKETLLLNYYSGVGINFQNITSNDAIIEAKINEMFSKGWDLKFIASSTESDAGAGDGSGIQVTRLFFYKE